MSSQSYWKKGRLCCCVKLTIWRKRISSSCAYRILELVDNFLLRQLKTNRVIMRYNAKQDEWSPTCVQHSLLDYTYVLVFYIPLLHVEMHIIILKMHICPIPTENSLDRSLYKTRTPIVEVWNRILNDKSLELDKESH